VTTLNFIQTSKRNQ